MIPVGLEPSAGSTIFLKKWKTMGSVDGGEGGGGASMVKISPNCLKKVFQIDEYNSENLRQKITIKFIE